MQANGLKIDLNTVPYLIPYILQPTNIILQNFSNMPQHKELPVIPLITLILGGRELTQGIQKDLKFGLMDKLNTSKNLINMLMVSIGLLQHVREVDNVTPLVEVVVELDSQAQKGLQGLFGLVVLV